MTAKEDAPSAGQMLMDDQVVHRLDPDIRVDLWGVYLQVDMNLGSLFAWTQRGSPLVQGPMARH